MLKVIIQMEFCDECGGMMFPSSANGIKVFKCKCGAIKPFSEEKSGFYKFKTKIEHPARSELTNLTEIMAWKDKNLKSSIKNFKCPRCGYTKAHLETRQTRRADEGMTHFITCLKCGKMKKIGS
jgi:DNA-directed RNA polymerase subunit M/transcription elongation factor TFIIS